jgi:hypothetical protein
VPSRRRATCWSSARFKSPSWEEAVLEVCLLVVREVLNPLRREAFRQGVSQALLREAASHPVAASHLAVVRLLDSPASRREAVSHPVAASHLAVVRLQDNLASRREAVSHPEAVSRREAARLLDSPASRREASLQEVSRGVRRPASSRREASLEVFQGRVASQDLAGCRGAAMTSTSPAGRARRMSKGWRRSSSTSSARSSGQRS